MSRAWIAKGGALGQGEGMEPSGVETVALAKLSQSLRSMRLCSPGERESLERSLARLGQLSPLLVFGHGNELEVIDGFKRLGAAQCLGWATISITQLDVTMTGAKVRLWQSNAGTSLSELEEAWLVQSLHREDKLTQTQIGQLFGRHKSWVNRRLLLVESLCKEAQVAVRLGLLSATNARELCRLPRGNQAEVAEVVTRRGLTKRQTTRLVDALMSAKNNHDDNDDNNDDDKAEPELLAQRLQAETRDPAKRAQRKRTPGEWLLADSDSIQRICGRLQARLLDRSLRSLGPEAEKRCGQRLSELQGVLNALCETIERITRAPGARSSSNLPALRAGVQTVKNEVRHGDSA